MFNNKDKHTIKSILSTKLQNFVAPIFYENSPGQIFSHQVFVGGGGSFGMKLEGVLV
jgi:hypothetical protein